MEIPIEKVLFLWTLLVTKSLLLNISLKKTEYLVTNSDAKFEVLINEDIEIKQVEKFKYLGYCIDKNDLGETKIKDRIKQGRKIVESLNSLWWDKNISKKTKKE